MHARAGRGRGPGSPAPAPSGGTTYVAWITSVSGTSLHLALGRHLVNAGRDQG